jgi:anti-sigma regulatory factor (Ser/Thr protein kinase)
MSRRADVVTGSRLCGRDLECGSDVGPASTEGSSVTVSDWPLTSSLVLGALPTAASCARLHARTIMQEWGLGEAAESVELLVSELVTNAVLASYEPNGRPRYEDGAGLPCVRVRISSDRARALVEVWDENPDMPQPRMARMNEENGRGLMLVDALSERCLVHDLSCA